jgi:hypothetical protein
VTEKKRKPSSQELAALDRWSTGMLALLDAGTGCEMVATALLVLIPGAEAAVCRLDGVSAGAGQEGASGCRIQVDVETAGQTRGELSVTVPAQNAGYQPLLSMAARAVALQLPDGSAHNSHLLELLTVGEAAGSLIHSINNHLNIMVLQAACVQMQAGSAVREQAEQIRREGARAAERMRCLQTVRPWPAREGERVDLVAALLRVLREESGLERVETRLLAGEVHVPGSVMGIQRFLTLLLRVAVRCTPIAEKVQLEVVWSGGVEMTVQLPGVACQHEEECLGLPPEPQGGLHQLEREAARWLLRQMGGYLETTEGPRGAILTVRWEMV